MPRRSGSVRTAVRSGDAVPVADRLRVTQYLRLVAIGLLLLAAALTPDVLRPYRSAAVEMTVVYGVGVVLAELVARLRPRRSLLVFSTMLVVDGIWLAWATYLTGSLTSPVHYVVLLHLGAVALLASYRTALKLALWHSLLTYGAYALQLRGPDGAPGVLDATMPALLFPGTASAAQATVEPSGQQLAVFVSVLWLVAISTSALSAVNERELRRRRADLEALAALAEALERAGDGQAVARVLLDAVADAFGFPRGVVVAGPDGTLPLLASYGLLEETARRPGRPGPSAVVTAAHASRATLLVQDLDADEDPWLAALLPGARNLVVVPLSADGRSLGAVVLEQGAGPGGRIPRRVVAGLERAVSYAALALQNAWLLEQVKRLAATDGLTKIANRRTFEATLEREVARATRAAEHVSLVMLDIDHFKALNDTHGHQAGDEVLRNVAAALTVACRDFDTPARYGGEEFAVVLPGCGPDEALAIGDRLRAAVSQAPGAVPITASAGVATYPSHAGDADALVRAADEALYDSKRLGRDRTTGAGGAPPQAQVDALLRRAAAQRVGRDRTTGRTPTPPAPRPGAVT